MTCFHGSVGMWEAQLLRKIGTLMANKGLCAIMVGLVEIQ